MKILFAFNQDLNPYVSVIMDGLARAGCPVESGTDKFWHAARFDHDIVHVQWPETLFDWRVPTAIELLFLRRRLKGVKQRAKLVYTRHNEVSHHANASNASILQELYSLLQTECDVMIHLDDASRATCLANPVLSDKTHVVIPIPVYDELYAPYANLDPAASRRKLGLPLHKNIVLAFGNFRFEREKQLVSDAFLGLHDRHTLLLAPKWHRARDYEFNPRHPMLLLRSARQAVWSWWNGLILGAKKTVSDEEVAACFSAADVVFIQRLDDLNSGNIPMAFLYGKVAVGPDAGNIGSILKAMGNPVFDPQNQGSVTSALRQALDLSKTDLGVRNRQFALTHWSTLQVAEAHASLYRSLLHS